MQATPIKQQLVLVGGGHANVQVILAFAMRPLADVSVVLISDQILAGYSGMLPGWIAGKFSREETHIDLARLCASSGVAFIHSSVTSIDTESQTVHCSDRPELYYDLLSINTGSKPQALETLDDASVIPIKPVEIFLSKLDQLLEKSDGKVVLSIIGAGVAGVEVMFSIQERYLNKQGVQYQLITSNEKIVPHLSSSARQYLREELKVAGVSTKTQFRLKRIQDGELIADNGDKIPSDITILCTGGKAPDWLNDVSIEKDERGFILVDTSLRSTSHTTIFAAGDIASMQAHDLEKSGVYAVRQGQLLVSNLRSALKKTSLKSYRPQKSFLKLISLRNDRALAVKGPLSLAGKWAWRWKKQIDNRFVNRFNDFSMLHKQSGEYSEAVDDQMRCSGCAAKINQSVLQGSLALTDNESLVQDDAALVGFESEESLFQSLDFFRALDSDIYLNTLLTLNHALNDSYAMGIIPHSVMSMIGLPPATNNIQNNRLKHIHLAITQGLAESGATLIGGHTAEMSEPMLGFSVNAITQGQTVWSKHGMQAGDVLLLTKPLGTGVLFAAHAAGKVNGEIVARAKQSLLMTHYKALNILQQVKVNACTDVTGFGLLGHLQQMMPKSGVKIALHLNSLPMLDGVDELLQLGIRSSLHEDNRQAAEVLNNTESLEASKTAEILFDPQTAGGLLVSIPRDSADSVQEQLVSAGYQSAVIGSVFEAQEKSTVYLEGFASSL